MTPITPKCIDHKKALEAVLEMGTFQRMMYLDFIRDMEIATKEQYDRTKALFPNTYFPDRVTEMENIVLVHDVEGDIPSYILDYLNKYARYWGIPRSLEMDFFDKIGHSKDESDFIRPYMATWTEDLTSKLSNWMDANKSNLKLSPRKTVIGVSCILNLIKQ